MKRKLAVFAAGLLLASSAATAAVTDDVIRQMKDQIAALTRQVAELEQQARATAQSAEQSQQAAAQASQEVAAVSEQVATANAATSWTDRIRIKGDFRYRYQNEDDQTASDERNRQRIRARPVIIADLPGKVEVGFGVATGSDDPVSTNQTLGGGGSSKGVNLDLAYFNWAASDEVHVIGGKFENALYTPGGTGLLWDGDWRPEGIQLTFDNGTFFGTALGTWLESDSKSDDEFAYGLQAGARGELAGVTLTGGVGYYDIDTAGRACVFEADDCFGNSFVVFSPTENRYMYDFQIVEGFLEAGFDVAGLPASVFVDYVNNGDADKFDTGISAGLKLGKAKKAGSWEAAYIYQDLEADAVLGLLTDSDFAGGGTDAKGHVLKTAYAVTDKTKVKLTYFMTERQDSNGLENGGLEYDYDTLQLDVEFKYD